MKSKLNCIVCIFLMIAGLGCALVKTTGVYTTLAAKENGLNLPYSQYTQKNSFGPDETPAAVVAGYGSYNDSQLLTLQLVEMNSGRVSEPNILQNTLDAECGDYFVRCLTTGSNFSPWPADLQAQFGKDSRIITLTFRFD